MIIDFNTIFDIYCSAYRIRKIEERIANEYPQGNIRCPVHLSVGQEILGAVYSQIQTLSDTAISTHRSHAHYLGKGGDLYRMIAEIYGKITGCCRGRGGSMHLVDTSCGFLGSSAIVGNSIPVGVGAAFAHKLNKDKGVTFIFLGDAAIEEGVFYESVNFSVVQRLPVVFLCENNLYSVYTSLQPRQPTGRKMTDLVKSIGIRAKNLNCKDPIQMFQELSELVENTRSGTGPIFVEVPTYRWLEHCGPFDDDYLGYRPLGELASEKLVDPITILLEQLKSFNQNNLNKKLETFYQNLKNEIDEVFRKAMNDPFPDLNDAIGGVYAE
jgi:pyruvate dehydrogenase E1 component alpha subunit